jgi:glutamate formiminotransferase/formiminotetrahydrofolate cyclodeaminase
MVAALTWAKKGMEDRRQAMGMIGVRGQALKDWFLEAVDRDTEAFDAVLAARRLPQASEAERAARSDAIRAADLEATRVPLAVLERAVAALELALAAARDGNPQSVSDAGVAGLCAEAAAEGAAYNVRINLPALGEGPEAASIRENLARLVARARGIAAEVRGVVDRAL